MHNELFFIVGFTVFVGYLSSLVAEKTKVSEVLLLIAFGFLLGPVFGFVDAAPSSLIVQILPFVASLALIVLLFDGGIMLRIGSVMKAIPKSTAFAVLCFAINTLLAALFVSLFLGWDFASGLLLGAVIGGTSSAIVIAMSEKTQASSETKAMLTVESTITDVLCIVVAIVVLKVIVASVQPDIGGVINHLLGSFTIAIFLGAFSALSWLIISRKFLLHKYNYMLTLALVFGIYAITDAVGANGGIAVFTFGLFLGNAKSFLDLLRIRIEKPLDAKIKVFQDEVTFFVRTFFFVYIGLLLSPDYFTLPVLAISLAILGLMVFSRWATARIVLPDLPSFDSKIVMAMMPRGLAAVVLATLPFASGVVIADFQQIVFAVILLSNVGATFGVYYLSNNHSRKEDDLKDTLKEAQEEEKEAERLEEEARKKKEEAEKLLEEEIKKKEKEAKEKDSVAGKETGQKPGKEKKAGAGKNG